MVVSDNQGIRVGAGGWALAFGRALGLGSRPGPKAQVPPKGQESGLGPDPDAVVVTDDHDIPHVSDNPKSILTSLHTSQISQTNHSAKKTG